MFVGKILRIIGFLIMALGAVSFLMEITDSRRIIHSDPGTLLLLGFLVVGFSEVLFLLSNIEVFSGRTAKALERIANIDVTGPVTQANDSSEHSK